MRQGTPHLLKKQLKIKSSLRAVWVALTAADHISRWYALDARVQPGEGGQIWLGWPGLYEEQIIEVWQEERRLRTRDELRGLTIDWILEGSANETLLCFDLSTHEPVPQSGHAHETPSASCPTCGEAHSDDSDMLARGWTMRLLGLKHMLENHPYGVARQLVLPLTITEGTPDELWAKLVGADGLGLERSSTGSSYRAHALTGDVLEGEVDLWAPPRALALSVRGLNDARLTFDLRGCATACTAWICLYTYGLDRAALHAIASRWKPALQALLRVRTGYSQRERTLRTESVETDSP